MSEFGIAMGVSVLIIVIEIPLQISAVFSRQTLDYNLYRFDAAFGFLPAFEVGRMLTAHNCLAQVSGIAYYGLPFMFVLFATGPAVTAEKPKLLRSMMAAGVIGAGLYLIVPAAGPIYVLHDHFPFDPPSVDRFSAVATVALEPTIPRNCIPSLHLGWALLIYLNVGWSSWRKIGSLLVLVLTAIATLGFGQHYLIDLIVAVPFVFAIQSGAELRWRATIWHAILTLSWLFALRWAAAAIAASSLMAWLLVTLTCSAIIWIVLRHRGQSQIPSKARLDGNESVTKIASARQCRR
jgi:hypothetical protein